MLHTKVQAQIIVHLRHTADGNRSRNLKPVLGDRRTDQRLSDHRRDSIVMEGSDEGFGMLPFRAQFHRPSLQDGERRQLVSA